jgi:hypothetical protein
MTVPCDECAVPCGDGRRRGEWYIINESAGAAVVPARGRIDMPLPRETDTDDEDCYTLPFKRIVEAAKAAGGDFDIAAAENVANVKWQISVWYDPDFGTTENDFFGECDGVGCSPQGLTCAEVSDVIPDTGVTDASGGDANTYCETNPDGDEDVDGNDLTKFLEDFGRGSYDRPCPNCRN